DYMAGRAQQTGDRVETFQRRIADNVQTPDLQEYLKTAQIDLVTSSAAAQAIDAAIGTRFSEAFPRFNPRAGEPAVNGLLLSEFRKLQALPDNGSGLQQEHRAETEQPGPSQAEIEANNKVISDMLNSPTQALRNKAANGILNRVSRLDEEQFGYFVDWL